MPYRRTTELTGLSHQRIGQIVKNRRNRLVRGLMVPTVASPLSEHLRSTHPDETAGYDERVEEWERRFERGERIASGAERLFLQSGYPNARRVVAVVSVNLASRVVSLSHGLAVLLNADNAAGSGPVARALYETCAVASYMKRNLTPLLVKRRAERAKVMLFRLGLGIGHGEWGRLRPYKVSAFVKALAQDADEAVEPQSRQEDREKTDGEIMRSLYAELSELTHPNFAALHLSQALGPRLEPSWTMVPGVDKSTLDICIGTAYLAMYYGGKAWDTMIRVAQQNPLALPDDDHFGPEDLHRVPEATEDA